ncbi:serine carboxypeptidase-like 51 isoform X1 [Momordica charantia]|uniref:Carboxypeptidase n=1 Tax=Momordica charantia TaxID=3673 RepID=A0A6J1CHY2_MOMCH|nr:serine carboxypeptidase-like 51 isoform X1 [Momordica charantia]
MAKSLFFFCVCCVAIFRSSIFDFGTAITQKSQDGTEEWGYVQVRPKAHMFWWHYRSPFRVDHASKPWPTVLWLQGGPGQSGVGMGNFVEIGPLDTNLKPRNSTWLRKADLLFVDNPVGTGYSYVEDTGEFAKGDEDAAADMTTLLVEISNDIVGLQNSPFYIIGESYGGKFAVTLALSLLRAIQAGKLKLNLRGVALGDSWISPEDYTSSWGPLLKDLSRLDSIGLQNSNREALKISQQIKEGNYKDAVLLWEELETIILTNTNNVDFYNFLLDSDMDPIFGSGSKGELDALMNGQIKNKLKIIPQNLKWGGQVGSVFRSFMENYMKPRINEVDELLVKGVNVTVYNGQVDLICSTKGTEAWIEKLKWEGLKGFKNTVRSPVFCGDDKHTKGFTKSYKNLHFYWILGAGLYVPVDQPCVALDMVGVITDSPAS